MPITKIENIIFIGGNRYKENGPMISFIEETRKKDISVILFTDLEHLSYETKDMGNFKNMIEKLKIPYEVKDVINFEDIKKYYDENTIIISVNCHFIFKKELINKVENKIFNYHNAAIPQQKGAACHSWRIMQGIRTCNLTFHKIIEKIDGGDVVFERKINFPLEANNLEKSYAYLSRFENSFFIDFLNLVESNQESKIKNIYSEKNEFYWPRLNTELNGWINWDWHVLDIVKFCNAFDSPFKGAGTFMDDKEVRLSHVSFEEENISFHPYQYGLIYRKEKFYFWIACNGGGLKVSILKSSGLKNIKLGKRFITPHTKLDNAKAGLK